MTKDEDIRKVQDAIRAGDIETVKEMISSGTVDVNERLGKLLEDFLEDNEKAKGWYYENADEKRVINEFQIIEQYRDTPSTQTNPVVKKANATESSNKKTFMNGHHFIASEWAKEVINKFLKESNKFVEFYDKYKAPVIMLRDTYRDSSHADITQSQRKRRMMTNSYIEERTLARKELQSIVVSEKNFKENEEDSKAYYDTLSSFEKKELQLLRIWELYQIEKGLKIVDDFYNEIRKAIKNEVVNNRNKYVYVKDNIPADENNINARLSEIFGY